MIVFSIAFDVPNANQRKVMEDCANKGNYFEADEKELESVFDNIAYRISELRLIR